MNASKSEGFDTNAELRAHFAELEADAPAEEGLQAPIDDISVERHLDDLKSEIDHLRDEIENLRGRLAAIGQQAKLRASVVVHASRWEIDLSRGIGTVEGRRRGRGGLRRHK